MKIDWNELCLYCNHSRRHHAMYVTKCNVKYCNCKEFKSKLKELLKKVQGEKK